MLIIVCGLQGTGKTFVAKRIAEKTNAVLLRTDSIRKELIKKPTYSEQQKQQIYDEMFSRTQKLLQKNRNIVLDATFAKKENRVQAKEIAETAHTDFKVVEIVCLEDVVRKRIKERIEDDSDAQFKHYLKYKRLFESVTEEHIIINNSDTLEDTDKQINKYF